MKLKPDQLQSLIDATRSVARPDAHTPRLAALGLVYEGRSRFGPWCKATEAGIGYVRSHPGLAAGLAQGQVTPPGVDDSDLPGRRATSGSRAGDGLVAIAPPATPLDVGETLINTLMRDLTERIVHGA